MKKLYVILIFVSFILILSGCGSSDQQGLDDKEVVPVRIISLSKEKVQKSIFASGQFTTEDETVLSFKTGGIIKKIMVKQGDAVKKGQLLAMLDLTEIDAQVLQAESAYEKAKRDFERANNLFKDSVASKSQMQDAKTGYELASQNLQIAKFNRNYSEIRALSDGFILNRFVNEGQLVGPGTPVLQTNGAGKKDWVLKTGISDNEWAAISINDKVFVELDVVPGVKLTGYVYKKSEGTDPYTGTMTVLVKISDPKVKLASGMFGKAEIKPSGSSEFWVIPFDALLDGDGNEGYVFITNDKTTAQKIKVNVAGFNSEKVYISGGLENNKYLIVAGNAYLNHNSKIRIIN